MSWIECGWAWRPRGREAKFTWNCWGSWQAFMAEGCLLFIYEVVLISQPWAAVWGISRALGGCWLLSPGRGEEPAHF